MTPTGPGPGVRPRPGPIGAAAARRAGAVAAGLVASRVLPEFPNRIHPVAWFGTAMGRVESALWADRRGPGALYTAAGVGLGAATGLAVRAVLGPSAATVVAVGLAAAGAQLRRTAGGIGRSAADGDLAAARARLPALVGRDPSRLDASGVAAAVIESVAENTVDGVAGPVVWALVAGAPGALAYRAVNTMDAMVGHRSPRYARFGWASARLDDGANLVPARLVGMLTALAVPGRAGAVAAAVRADASAHPSPNAGVAEAAMAGSLGRRLGGPLRNDDRVEQRPTLGSGPRPEPADVGRAVTVADGIEWLITAGLAAAWLAGRAQIRR
ncbi:MAG: cobalamin biosynthesis protein [Acidimicrobiales bacterium]